MIFKVRRASGFPIVLEPEEEHALKVLEEQQRWAELEDYERTLRQSDALKELNVECEKLEELVVFLSSINAPYAITVSFGRKTIIIQDNGEDIQ